MKNAFAIFFIANLVFIVSSKLTAQSILEKVMENPNVFPERLIKKNEPQGNIIGQGLFSHRSPLREVYCRTTKVFAGVRDGKLYARLASADEINFIAKPETGWYWNIDGAMWSPNGKYIVVAQVDDRAVPTIKLTHKNPSDISYKKYSKAGEELPKYQFYVVDVESKIVKPVPHGQANPYIHLMGWNPDGTLMRFLTSDRLLKRIDLIEIDLAGTKSTLLSEHSDAAMIGLNLLQGNTRELSAMNVVWFLDSQQKFIWQSEQTGYNQLYLYDLKGNLIRPLTNKSKNGIVSRMVDVDNKSGWVYFKARSNSNEPYAEQLFRASLSSSSIEKLVEGPSIYEIHFNAALDCVWVWHGDKHLMMQTDLYTNNGKHLKTTWQSNLRPLLDRHFELEYVTTKADDNQTSIESVIIKPEKFDPSRKYPVVESIYAGPNDSFVPRYLDDPFLWEMQKLSDMGFIVVITDGRGTPGRGREFQNYTYGKFGLLEIKDHVNAIRQLSKDRPYMNIAKVGVAGHSWGGHFSLRALVEEPTFYKAGFISAAPVDPVNFRTSIEPFMGCLPQNCVEKFKQSGISEKLKKLIAPIMISHGTADDDVPFDESIRLVNSLKQIGKSNFELVEYQGADHALWLNEKYNRSIGDFFKKAFLTEDR
jgi:dipeptidyl-peptidase-4